MNEHDKFFEELQKDVDADHLRIDGAAAPPAGMWKSIRAQANPESQMKERTMSTATATPFVPVANTPTVDRASNGFRHTLNLAASFLLVASVALAGWFATMQLNAPGGSDGQHGLIAQDWGDGTCEVEPMTVDEVMEIVENPYRYMDEDEYPNPIGSSTHETPWEDEYQEVQPRLPVSLNVGLATEPTQAAFDQASEVISDYVACLQSDGTVAMMLRFADPFSIQQHVRSEFPFYRTEDQVRDYVTEWIATGEIYHALSYERQGETFIFRPAVDKEMAGTQIHDFGLGFDQVIYVGSEIYAENGEFVGNFHPTLYMTYNVDQEYLDHGVVFTLLHSRYTGEWYIVTDGWMDLHSVI